MALVLRHSRLTAPTAPTVGLSVPPPGAGVTGAARTTYTGGDTINTAGALIEHKNIINRSLYVTANNVTIRDCLIDNQEFYGIDSSDTITGLTIDHCTIIGSGLGQGGCLPGNNGQVLNCDISRWENGILFNGNTVLVEGAGFTTLASESG